MTVAQPYHHGNLREELLDRAEKTLRTHGVEGISLRELAREAGVSHAAPRRHFSDRQALLDALSESGFLRLTSALQSALDAAHADARSRFAALAASYVRFALDHAELMAVMFGIKHSANATDALLAAGRTSMELTIEVVRAAQATGEITAGDPERIATVAFATFHGIATLAAGGMLDGSSVSDVVDDAVRVTWSGLASEPTNSPHP